MNITPPNSGSISLCVDAVNANLDAIMSSAQEAIQKTITELVIPSVTSSNQAVSEEETSKNEVSRIRSESDGNYVLPAPRQEWQGVLLNYFPELNTSHNGFKDSSVEKKRKRVISKLTAYYGPSSDLLHAAKRRYLTNLPHSSSANSSFDAIAKIRVNLVKNCCESPKASATAISSSQGVVSNDSEKRFVLVGSMVDKSDDIRSQSGKLKKLVKHKKKAYLLPHHSPGKFSSGKSSPSRRPSIMEPLTSSPSTDHMDRKYLDFNSFSQHNFIGDISAPSSPFSSDLFSDKSDLRNKRSLESSTDLTSRKKLRNDEKSLESIKKMETALSVAEKKLVKKSRRKTPHMLINKFTKKRRKSVQNNSEGEGGMPATSDEYEVEYLESHKVTEDNMCLFFVKWIGWDSADNTWEPITNLLNCQEKLVDYFGKLLKAGKRQEIEILRSNAALSGLRQNLSIASNEELNNLLATYRFDDGLKLPVPDKEYIGRALQLLSKQKPEEVNEDLKIRLQHELLLEKLCVKRKSQLDALKDWELEINFVAQNSARISVENDFDLEGPPANFNYINHYLPGADVIIPNDPPFGCDCSNDCSDESQLCCGKESGFAYDEKGRIKVPLGTPIYECNNRCTCPASCCNRVIQRGQNYRLCIFKTSNGCGWGVKALEDIKKGSFITKYVGEVITADEAAHRANSESKFYLFDLDFNSHDNSPCPFTVDALTFGNISHFINHSCDPNLAIYAAWINCLDPNIPLLVLFAIKDIRKGDELCFSYSRTDTSRRRKGEVKCRCNASHCRKYVF